MVLISMAIMVGLMVAYHFLKPDPPEQTGTNAVPAGEDAFRIPTAEEGKDITVVFGTRRCASPNVVWWGNVTSEPVIEIIEYEVVESGIGGLWGETDTEEYEQIVGFKYRLGMHIIPCLGPIDSLKEIWTGDLLAWSGTATGDFYVDNENLYGGEEEDGGVSGNVSVLRGFSSQPRDSYLQSVLASDCPAFRRVASIVLKDFYIGMTPYMKAYSFLIDRRQWLVDGTSQWYSSKAYIGVDLNPIHILREIMTSQTIGLGINITYIDSVSFTAAADTLYDEGFGLSFEWGSDQDPEDFMNNVLRHINGFLYQDMSTGQYVVKLARDDYVIGDLPLYDENDIISFDEFQRPGLGEIVNWVVVKYHDRAVNKPASVTVQDMSMIDKEDKVVSATFVMNGICSASLANRVASRILREHTSLLSSMTVTANRNMAGLKPGDMIKVSWATYGIVEMPLRVLSIEYGTVDDGSIRVNLAEDVFSAGDAFYDDPVDTLWVDPSSEPADVVFYNMVEMPYQVILDGGVTSKTSLEAIDPTTGLLGIAAAKPVADAFDFKLLIRTDSSYSLANAGSKYWSPTATLVNALPLSAAAATVPLENGIDLFRVEDGPGYALLGTEWVEITGFDASSYEVDIKRGLFDTVPAAHVAGERIWFMSTYLNKLSTVYSAGKHPDIKMLTRTGKGILDEGNATLRSMSPAMNSRFIRPYPPGRFEINDASYPPIFIGQPALTWAHRNRETQLGTLVSADEEGSWALEAGAYYTLKIYKENGALMQTITPIVTEGYTLSELDERNWSGLGSADDLNSQLRFVLTVHRADHSSGTPTYDGWQSIDWTSDRFGIVPLPDNDFTGSGEGVIALWNMESAALTTDSIGSNTLSNNGVTADTSRKMQGGSSAYMTTGDWMDITDASLNTGFPFRSADGSGAVEEFTICAWVALDSLPGGGYHTIIAKYDWNNSKRSWMCDIHSDYWGFLFGYNNGASDLVVNCSSITKPVVGRWYHVAWTFENSTGGWKCRVYDTWTDSVEEETGTIAQTASITDSIVEIGRAGSTNYMDGSIDELVVFNRILSSADIDKIRQGTYGS